MTIQKGQRVVSRSGFVFEVVKRRLNRVWFKSMQSGLVSPYDEKDILDRFGSQMPPEFPVEKLSA